jgi:hypothetical protein
VYTIHYLSIVIYNLAQCKKTVLPIEGRGGANAETIAVVVERINAVENFMTVNILRYYVVVSLNGGRSSCNIVVVVVV